MGRRSTVSTADRLMRADVTGDELDASMLRVRANQRSVEVDTASVSPFCGAAVGMTICYEAIWPGAYSQPVRDGAALLVNLTDDGWLGDTAGPPLHLNAAILRAVETRRWLVRASNSGTSAFIDPTGAVVASLPFGAVGVLTQRVAVSTQQSLFVRFGNWILVVSVLGVLLSFACRPRSRQCVQRVDKP